MVIWHGIFGIVRFLFLSYGAKRKIQCDLAATIGYDICLCYVSNCLHRRKKTMVKAKQRYIAELDVEELKAKEIRSNLLVHMDG